MVVVVVVVVVVGGGGGTVAGGGATNSCGGTLPLSFTAAYQKVKKCIEQQIFMSETIFVASE